MVKTRLGAAMIRPPHTGWAISSSKGAVGRASGQDIGDAGQHVSEPHLRLNVVHPRSRDQAVHHCCLRTPAIRAGK
jgi:hypothetical protein